MGLFCRRTRRDEGPRRALERGATLVEYALITSVVLAASLGAIKRLENNADRYYDTTSSRIGALPSISGAMPTGTSIPGASSTTTVATTTTSTTTTTLPPTTTTSTSTTTTSTSTTSTTVAPRSFVSATANTSDTSGFNSWRPALTSTIRNKSTNALISGASVTVTFRTTGGSTLGTATCTTDSTGTCKAQISGVSDTITTVVATVTSVTSTPTWDGATSALSLAHP